MPSVYDGDAFESRVNFAAAYIAAGRATTRHFDTCFEMHDGDYVAAALVARTIKNPNTKLAANIWKYIGRDTCMRAYEELKHIPRKQLAARAAEYREQCRKEFAAYMEKVRREQSA